MSPHPILIIVVERKYPTLGILGSRLLSLRIYNIVQEWKGALTRKQENLYNVDWLTEAIRRFSQAYLMGRGWSTVDMSVPTRVEKVISNSACDLAYPLKSVESGNEVKPDSLIGNGV